MAQLPEVSGKIDEAQVRVFEKTEAQLEGFYDEIAGIAKKRPDDPINKFKLTFINQMLTNANQLLGDVYGPFPDFEAFDVDELPTASDVAMMLSQYLRAMDKCRKDHTFCYSGIYYWLLPGQTTHTPGEVSAQRPKDFES